jgi:hypothetical protein
MLEHCIDQAAGLQGLALQHVPRLVAVASHGHQQGELPLLWGLCASWVEMGFTVLVLDGHTQETPQNPGLFQLLSKPLGYVIDDEASTSWTVIPAANGLNTLACAGLLSSPITELFKNYGMVLLYANAGSISRLLKGYGLAPVLIVPPALTSAVSAYQALKQLILDGHLHPTVANIVPEQTAMMPMPTTLPAKHVMECASIFLGYSTKPLTITASAKVGRSQDDINHLAVQMLENALPLERQPLERIH